MLFAVPSLAYTTNPDGGSGDITSQSADTLPENELVSYGYLGRDDSYSSGWQHEVQMLTGFYAGLTDKSEAGIGLSIANNSADLATGYSMRYLLAHGKYRFYGSRDIGEAASVYFYSTTGEVPNKPSLASGKTSTGVHLIYSTYGAQSYANYSLGLDTGDYKIYSGGAFSYVSVPMLTLSASRMFYTSLDRIYELGIKAQSATINGSSNGNAYLVMAAHFDSNEPLKYSAGAMLNLPGGAGVLKARYFVGFSYSNKFTNERAPVATPQVQKPTVKPSPVQKSKPVAPTAPQVNNSGIRTKPCLANVEVMDMSGINGLGERVAEELRGDGYCVPSIYTEGDAMSYFSQLYFAKGDETISKDIAKKFDIKGSISERLLPSGVDIRFIVGRDQQ